MSRRLAALGAFGSGVVAITATAILSWWLIGDLTVTDPRTADYLFRPPALSAATERSMVIGAAIALVLALIGLVLAWRKLGPAPEWILVIGLWLAAGAAAGGLERVVTVGVVGANIGGGLALMVSPVAVIGLLGATVLVLGPLRARADHETTS